MSRGRVPLLVLPFVLACGGADQDPGQIATEARPGELVRARAAARRAAAPPHDAKQVLFGDLHVHTTYSMDAYFTAMPLLGGEGAHPPADACDFARHCAGLDFFAITDHARELTPAHWAQEKDMVRQCNAVAGDPAAPDLVAFHGFEWTHVGLSAETHWGHKNVIYRGLGEDEVPPRPITSIGPGSVDPWMDRAPVMSRAGFVDPLNWRAYADFEWMLDRIVGTPACDPDLHTRDLPAGCHEDAPTPRDLFRKLDEGGYDALVIPHGTAWGSYTPPTTSWDKQLTADMHDPDRQRLIEVMSGHGNSEPYRDWREFERGPDGTLACAPPDDGYLPCCWQAGEIVRARCADLPAAECEARVEEARLRAMQAGNAFAATLPGTGAEHWLDCGQDRAGFKPAYGLRPRGSVQYALGLTGESEDGAPLRFRFGLLASSDSHTGRAATGFKQTPGPRGWTDMTAPRSDFYRDLLLGRGEPEDPQRAEAAEPDAASTLTVERLASFLYPGGAVAVHASGRDRDAIWQALGRREVYGTSGPRILLWFDHIAEDGRRDPMGAELSLARNPRFEVRAVGAFEQAPGCPEDSVRALGAERVGSLCLGECYRPTDRRHPIEAIEVVRIRPQASADGDPGAGIEDPWRRFPCPPGPAGCSVRFEDPDFARDGRDSVYYVRALQTATPARNGANLRTRFAADGRPESVRPCAPDSGEDPAVDCMAPVNERAWSSPIFVDVAR